MEQVMRRAASPLLWAILGMLALASAYFLFSGWISGDWRHPWVQFISYKYWMTALILGFGVQLGLFQHLRAKRHRADARSTVAAGAGGGTSVVAMVACCAHHLTDLVPIMGLSAAATFLVEYQVYLLGVGVVSNLVGIGIMLAILQGKNPLGGLKFITLRGDQKHCIGEAPE